MTVLHHPRRVFLQRLGAGALTVVSTSACSPYFVPERGPAFAPWDFPDPALDPRLSLVHAALLAASAHNTQPWTFVVADAQIELFAALERTIGAVDPFLRELHVSLGCALENLAIAARQAGWSPAIAAFPAPERPDLVARVTLVDAEPVDEPLYAAIAIRHTSRGPYADFSLDPRIEQALAELVDEPSVTLVRLTGAALDRWRRVTVEATEAFVADAALNGDSHAWYRHSLDDITRHRDGLTTDAAGLGAATRFAGKLSRPLSAARSGQYWLANTRDVHVRTGSAVFALCNRDRLDRPQQLATGRIWQRLHLWCADAGIDAHPINQMIELADHEAAMASGTRFRDELAALAPPGDPAMLFRVGYAHLPPFASPRRPVDWISEGPA